MALYEKQFTAPYTDGYVDRPTLTTPVTADILNMMDTVLAALEDFLTSEEVGFTQSLTAGDRTGNAGAYSYVFGKSCTASGTCSHAEGQNTNAYSTCSHAEGYGTTASTHSHAEGYGTQATGIGDHAEGKNTTANGGYSHAEGYNTTASSSYTHAEGYGTTASRLYSHAEGLGAQASGTCSHAEGYNTTASGNYAHAEGTTIASGEYQHTQGKYNEEDTEGIYAHIIGGGTSATDRRNIHTVDWDGNAVFAGDVTDGNGNSISGLKEQIPEQETIDIDFSTYFVA